MYPLGMSTEGVLDMTGNSWEWQADYRGKEHDFLSARRLVAGRSGLRWRRVYRLQLQLPRPLEALHRLSSGLHTKLTSHSSYVLLAFPRQAGLWYFDLRYTRPFIPLYTNIKKEAPTPTSYSGPPSQTSEALTDQMPSGTPVLEVSESEDGSIAAVQATNSGG